MSTIGDRIKAKRKELGLTQVELAKKLCVTDRAVSKWEQNEGNPDISILPKIAEVFNVSLDYLMTGIEAKKEIVFMSKIELAAKNDDPSLIDDFSYASASLLDETGTSLFDYVKKYNSKKVLTALVDSCSHPSHYASLFNCSRYGHGNQDLSRSFDIIKRCIPIDRERKVINEIYGTEIRNLGWGHIMGDGAISVSEFLIENYDALTSEQKEYYFDLKEEDKYSICSGPWLVCYPYLVDFAIKYKKEELFNKLCAQIVNHNNLCDLYKQSQRNSYSYYYSNGRKFEFVFNIHIYLFSQTLDYLLEEKSFDWAYKVNEFLEKPKKTREIDLLRLENDDKIPESEKLEFCCVNNNILVPSAFEKVFDLNLARKIIDNNYVNYYEMTYDLLTKDKKRLFRFFIDNGLTEFANLLIKGEYGQLLSNVYSHFNYERSPLFDNQLYLLKVKGYQEDTHILLYDDFCEKYSEVFDHINATIYNSRDIYSREYEEYIDSKITRKLENNEIIAFFREKKEEIYTSVVDRLAAIEKQKQEQLEKAKAIKGLDRQYFENLLNENGIELFVIKLCALFDAILKYDYHYEADDFYGRMQKYFADGPKSRKYDDEWGFLVLDTEYEESTVKPWQAKCDLFNRLRIQRNNIAHSETNKVKELSLDELRECMDYVLSLCTEGE